MTGTLLAQLSLNECSTMSLFAFILPSSGSFLDHFIYSVAIQPEFRTRIVYVEGPVYACNIRIVLINVLPRRYWVGGRIIKHNMGRTWVHGGVYEGLSQCPNTLFLSFSLFRPA
ncbi:hypothetical protein K504DRAFT_35322 [Pleomassaria siparia CBS 279.74]|uniref:Uncharacterized protein n=1 Tax=Pleomassaria siparia CBS 279.74 TaxID=1314801 RepID=A0A6G1KTH5_9PLEO|nr:hypothetical protein K504DRAFT_35322 [Pleomassaria siparia CBS 279.74]